MTDIDYTLEQENDSDLVKNLRKQIREKDATLKALSAENETFKTTARKSTVADILAKRNVNSKVAAFVPADVEATEEAVGKWLEEYGDVFGATAPPAPAEQPQPGNAPQAPVIGGGVDAATIAALAAVQQAGQQGAPVTVTSAQTALDDWKTKAASAGSMQELIAHINASAPKG